MTAPARAPEEEASVEPPARRRRPARVSSREDPDRFETLLVDPALHVAPEAIEIGVRDMKRWTRRYLKPPLRVFSNVAVWCIVAFKRVLPFQFRAHGLIDSLCVWFMRRFVSADAARSLIRHFIVETNLVSFVVNNCGADDVPDCDLRPANLEQMGERTVIRHDLNIYNLVLDLGTSKTADVDSRRPLDALDLSMFDVPEIDAEDDRFRWLELDIESALYLMNLPFALFTTEDEYERAVNSFQLDESLLGYIANMTGDPVFRTWTPNKFFPHLSIAREVPRDLYWHALVNEFAHERLIRMRDALARGEAWPPEARDA
jgi:hypothetical protein